MPGSRWPAAGRRAEPDSRAAASSPPAGPLPHTQGSEGCTAPRSPPARHLPGLSPQCSACWLWGRGRAGGSQKRCCHCSGGTGPIGQSVWSRCSHSGRSPALGQAEVPRRAPAPSPAQHHCSLTSMTGHRLCRPGSGRQRDRERSDTDGDTQTGRDGDNFTKAGGPPG